MILGLGDPAHADPAPDGEVSSGDVGRVVGGQEQGRGGGVFGTGRHGRTRGSQSRISIRSRIRLHLQKALRCPARDMAPQRADIASPGQDTRGRDHMSRSGQRLTAKAPAREALRVPCRNAQHRAHPTAGPGAPSATSDRGGVVACCDRQGARYHHSKTDVAVLESPFGLAWN